MASDPELTAQATAIADTLRATLSHAVLGIYLYGSATAGGLRPQSDLDIFAVSGRRMADVERATLSRRLAPLSARSLRLPGWRPAEVSVVVADEVRPWRSAPPMDFLLGEWMRGELDAGGLPPRIEANPDLAVLITMVLGARRVLYGPPPEALLDPFRPMHWRVAWPRASARCSRTWNRTPATCS